MEQLDTLKFLISEDDEEERIDKFLSENIESLSRSYLQKLIKDRHILVNGCSMKASYKCQQEDIITVMIPKTIEPDILPEDIPLDILYEDSDVIVVNKPKGMVVHPAAGHYGGTLVNALLYHCNGNLSGINGVMRPGIVHRIDMDTTGSLIVCKNDLAHASISKQLMEHTVNRKYRAIVHGRFAELDDIINVPIGRSTTDRKKMAVNPQNGKEAVTHYHVIEQFDQYAYIECILETGRTHQIRVHMTQMGHPLLGDTVYGNLKSPFHLQGQTLHAMTLGFCHPTTGRYVEVNAPLPAYFEKILGILRNG